MSLDSVNIDLLLCPIEGGERISEVRRLVLFFAAQFPDEYEALLEKTQYSDPLTTPSCTNIFDLDPTGLSESELRVIAEQERERKRLWSLEEAARDHKLFSALVMADERKEPWKAELLSFLIGEANEMRKG